MSKFTKWTRQELYLALCLYCRIPFGKIHSGNPQIIALANTLGRTAGAVAMKLCNFASLDPSLKQKGLASCSILDREVWNDFFTNPSLVLKTEDSLSSIVSGASASPASDWDYATEDVTTIVKARKMQSFFRSVVLTNYGFKCCITGLECEELLVASHIIPWKSDKDNRLNPHNGLCLNALHDKAFDRGLLTIDLAMKVVISPLVPRKKEHSILLDYEGKTISAPEKFSPSSVFLQYHRESIFRTR